MSTADYVIVLVPPGLALAGLFVLGTWLRRRHTDKPWSTTLEEREKRKRKQ